MKKGSTPTYPVEIVFVDGATRESVSKKFWNCWATVAAAKIKERPEAERPLWVEALRELVEDRNRKADKVEVLEICSRR